jgi:hypothetical protein
MGDLTLPKFSDCKSQHTVNFLKELFSAESCTCADEVANCDKVNY